MKRPSFQFYPGDWQANSNLRRCTHAEKGAWLDVMCLLHDQPEYGILRWPLKEVAQAIGCSPALLKGLITKGVLKGDDKRLEEEFVYVPRSGRKDGEPTTLVPTQDGPIWYSSRMVKDEYVRTIRGESTRFGSENQPDKAARQPREDTDRAKLRASIWEKAQGHCHHCNVLLGGDWEIDHYIPRSKGGRHIFSNLVASCRACNQDKSDTMPDDWVSPSHAPTRRVGEGQGDGSSSSSSSSSSDRESASQAPPPVSPPRTRKTKPECTLTTYLGACRSEGKKPIPEDHFIRGYCKDAGISTEMLQVAWLVFRDEHTTGKNKDKRQKDWPAHFANAVKGRWARLWFMNERGEVEWTATGLQEKRVIEVRMNHTTDQGASSEPA